MGPYLSWIEDTATNRGVVGSNPIGPAFMRYNSKLAFDYRRIRKMQTHILSFLLSFFLFLTFCIQTAFSEDIKQTNEVKKENKTHSKTPEKTPEEKKLTFRARETDLWFKSSIPTEPTNEKFKKSFVETTLKGELYATPKKILDVTKEKADRGTPEGLLSSYFSASEEGDVNWIADNFLDAEKEKIKEVFSDKKNLKGSKKNTSKMKSKQIVGEAYYKDLLLLFVEQNYGKGNIITEAVACKKTDDGWKVTNSISDDKIFDIVFAALSAGEVLDSEAAKPTIIHKTIKIN